MNSNEQFQLDEHDNPPVPMKSRPVLQALSWLGGVAAGFGVFVTLVGIFPARVSGATSAAKAKWRQWQNGPVSVDVHEAALTAKQVTCMPASDVDSANQIQQERCMEPLR